MVELVAARCRRGALARSLGLVHRHPVAIPLVLSLIFGAIYAAMLPPWDLIDEEQHVHYIQYFAERRELPTMGDTYLSPEIVASLVETNRWQRLRLAPPPNDDPRDWGLEGLSYEAYQPPLFYVTMSVPYALLPDQMLVKLYGLRVLVVLLGTLSVLGSYVLVRGVWPDHQILAVAVATTLTLIPERAMAVSRVNNDVLVELLSVLALLLLAQCVGPGFDLKRGMAVGAVVGLALLAKLSAAPLIAATAVVWVAGYGTERFRSWLIRGAAIAATAALVSGWFFYRNIAAYGEPTGIASFVKVARFAPEASFPAMLGEIARGFWGLWWWNRPLYAFGVVAALAFVVALFGVGLCYARGRLSRQQGMMLAAMAALVLFAAAGVWQGASSGWVPFVQGRFMLPAYAPIVILFWLGMFRLAPVWMHTRMLGAAIAPLALLNAYVLFYLLPSHYPLP
ncbi:MAG: hypothetical protein HY675_18895 [Chloroflexi bacterium]|nr:hypothetical protein [Chloroflexota bacterium]